MTILDGKKVAAEIRAEMKKKVEEITGRGGKRPHLCAMLVGNDGASMTYVASKERACAEVGFKSTILRYPDTITQEFLLEEVARINDDADIDGLICQVPLPKHIDETAIVMAISPSKDVDGFHPVNVGKMTLGLPSLISATPKGILTLLQRYGIHTSGMNCVVLGRSSIVGRPIANLLSQKSDYGDCTVTLCHSHTRDIRSFTLNADMIVTDLGIPGFVKEDMVHEGAVVIDVGITRVPADTPRGYVNKGDVDFDRVAPKCSFITPVPGGVGPMTIASLLQNTLQAAMQH
ncbi:MAG: bifunctional 5,10-methylene-tetrahydrofolate dehydrogenase/5,10-methylene-tetrahydrofolate cyclohydrolase [Bacteroidales bacterium]|jgi:methylenetetrahydrofolate dehydrogenase (NADP+)/methenyltetrahydrofolate cyclohydrolase|nr:bifunctional 5,10-methylene-tetrahydrofolate dehydrogenase/5,10-methylene-tetrahydrofolate cyclohydrolase [Bacteroidales bacterium]MCI2121612.1 bifunctional 5,10-methylene-tetrahydrofolate dehydrogenase/5,10-methylene-tetrahydrofolate cyclohydrolase [Bacteroidales bacterium]MCI2144709.1 bifunctional 5,10-methylene-tetrahydrofolate dehydrogenase/5,10-methylene-tetrahydrofolate cyclohydrolase [Bacteroidales bacterium]